MITDGVYTLKENGKYAPLGTKPTIVLDGVITKNRIHHNNPYPSDRVLNVLWEDVVNITGFISWENDTRDEIPCVRIIESDIDKRMWKDQLFNPYETINDNI